MAAGDTSAARRYAQAMFGVARDRNAIDEVAESLDFVARTTAEAPQLLEVLHHPRVTRQRKQALLKAVFAQSVRPDVEHLLLLMVEKDRATIIPNVIEQFHRLLDEHRHQVDVEVTSAIPLSEAQTGALKQRIESSSGTTVRLKTRVDESILGGLVVRIGDKLIDGSVASQLQAMREQLKRAKVT